MRALRTLALLLLGVALGFAVGYVASERLGGEAGRGQVPRPLGQGPRSAGELGLFAELARRLEPTVVSVGASSLEGLASVDELIIPRWGDGTPWALPPWLEQAERWTALGSGVIIDPQGYVVTNAHVIENIKPKCIVVTLADRQRIPAKLVGSDRWTDIALLKAQAERRLPAAQFGDDEELQVGEWVMAIGNPFGLGRSVTVGVVSAKARSLGGPYDRYLQTDAAINPGNSGGPLFDTRGKLVGINTAIGQGEGIGFAIPSSLVREVVEQLRAHGRVIRGFIGVVPYEITETVAKNRGIDVREGAYVERVEKNSPADRAGIRRGDIIVEFNGRKIRHRQDLFDAVARAPVGETVNVVVLRNGRKEKLRVTVARRPDVLD